MSEHYTDEDVEAAVRILQQPRMHTNMSGDKHRADMRAVLDAVAPAIAARALREFAKVFMGETPGLLLDAGTCRSIDLLAQEMADEIEAVKA